LKIFAGFNFVINAFESGIVAGGGAAALPLEVVGGGGIES